MVSPTDFIALYPLLLLIQERSIPMIDASALRSRVQFTQSQPEPSLSRDRCMTTTMITAMMATTKAINDMISAAIRVFPLVSFRPRRQCHGAQCSINLIGRAWGHNHRHGMRTIQPAHSGIGIVDHGIRYLRAIDVADNPTLRGSSGRNGYDAYENGLPG